MSFKEVQDLDCDVTVQLGGINKKTKKANPTSIEGYYLGAKTVKNPKSKTGLSKLHIFQTDKGNVGAWGKTDSDNKLATVEPGTMTRVTFDRMLPTPNGDMYKYRVESDDEDRIDPPVQQAAASNEGDANAEQESAYADEGEEAGVDEEEQQPDEVPPARAKAPARAAAAPSPDRRARVQSLLNGRNKTA